MADAARRHTEAAAAPAATEVTGEMQALANRLRDAEATLDALIAGQVDAVTLPGSGAPVLLEKAQDALRRSEQRYREIVAQSPSIVCELEPDGTVRYVNHRIHDLLGYDPYALVGRNLWDVIVPGDGRDDTLARWTELRDGGVEECEIAVQTATGAARTFVWNATSRSTSAGTVDSVIAFGLDISERRRREEIAQRLAAEQAARAAAERAEGHAMLLAEVSRVLSSSLDVEQTLTEVASLVVPALGDWCAVHLATEQGGVRRLALSHRDPGRTWQVGSEQRPYPPVSEVTEGIERVLASGKDELYTDIVEFLGATARAEERPELLSGGDLRSAIVAPLRVRDRSVGAISLVMAESGRRYEEADRLTARDLAQRAAVAVENARLYHEAQDARDEAEHARAEAEHARAEAEHANRAKSDFLASMSHELRTPLNAIAGYVQLLDEEIQGPLNEGQRQYLRRVRLSEEHLLGLINGVLNFAKLEAGHVEFALSDVALGPMLSEVEALITPQVAAKGLTYRYAGCESEICVRADGDKLRQIVLNLLSNAVKFTPAGGVIEVSCRRADTSGSVTVRDDGIGVPTNQLEAIFDPFVQIGKQANREGTGLGLAISRELARAMRGDLTAESTPGEGSAFTLRIPLAGQE